MEATEGPSTTPSHSRRLYFLVRFPVTAGKETVRRHTDLHRWVKQQWRLPQSGASRRSALPSPSRCPGRCHGPDQWLRQWASWLLQASHRVLQKLQHRISCQESFGGDRMCNSLLPSIGAALPTATMVSIIISPLRMTSADMISR